MGRSQLAPEGSRVPQRARASLPHTDLPRAQPSPAHWRLRAIIVLLDAAAALLAMVIWWLEDSLSPLAGAAGVAGFVCANRLQGLYRSYMSCCHPVVYAGLIRSSLLFGATTWLISSGAAKPSPGPAVVAVTFVALTAALGRHAFDYWLGLRRAEGEFRRRVIVVASDGEAARMLHLLRANPSCGFEVVALLGPSRGAPVGGLSSAGGVDKAVEVARLAGATGAVVCPAGLAPHDLHAAVRGLERAGLHVHVPSWLQGVGLGRLRAVEVGHESFLYLEPPRLTRWQLAAKRTMDIVLAAVALILSAPVLLAAAAAVKLQDGGPVLFRQERVGLDGRRFSIHKLRTMEIDAEHRLAELAARNERTGPLFKITDDPRVTRLGALLRSTSIDELPQLLDVLRGTMSMVGPRPPLPSEVAEFDDELLDRFSVRPGITGLWQVEGRDHEDFAVYRRLDLFYVENWSLLLDVGILLDTIPAVVGRALQAAPRPSRRAEVPLLVEPEHLTT